MRCFFFVLLIPSTIFTNERSFGTMANFHSLKVQEIKKETQDTVSVTLDIPLGLQDSFAFRAGQYLTFKQSINGEEIRRSYSLCSAPSENIWKVAVKQVPNGKFSTFANHELKIGDELETMEPNGRFVYKSSKESNQYVFFAAGSGITPILSIIKEVFENEKQAKVHLFYGNRTSDSIIFKEDLEALKNEYLDQFVVQYLLSQERRESELLTGRLSGEKCKAFAKVFFDPLNIHQFFICGPEQMIFSLKDQLIELGVAEEKIKFELFTTAESKAFEPAEYVKPKEDEDAPSIKVILDGDSFDFRLRKDGPNILDAALNEGADLPFACKGGVCCTCKAKLQSGKVSMTVNYGLEPDEIANGYILTCQAHPETDELIVDFDS